VLSFFNINFLILPQVHKLGKKNYILNFISGANMSLILLIPLVLLFLFFFLFFIIVVFCFSLHVGSGKDKLALNGRKPRFLSFVVIYRATHLSAAAA